MDEYEEVNNIISNITKNDKVIEMKKYIQHGNITTYEHCINVTMLSYKIYKKLKLHSNLEALIYGAMLHDFYLYDWHQKGDGSHRLHGFRHAKRAANNAKEIFDIDKKTYRVIYTHMWPLNLFRIPTSRVGWIVCFADKIVSTKETFSRRKNKKK